MFLLSVVIFSLGVKANEGKPAVAIDPGHQGSWVDMSGQEAMAPGSDVTKAKATTGTEGRYSGVPEYELNLRIGLALREELSRRGYEVMMTREDHDTAVSNQERAKAANAFGADICVRIHANSSEDSAVSGALAMAPSEDNPYVGELSKESASLAECVLECYCDRTGLDSQGVIWADDMTGINFSEIPVTILEMGYMSNEKDDLYMNDETHEAAMVQGIADGIDQYFDTSAVVLEGDKKSSHQQLSSASEMDFSGLLKNLTDTYLTDLQKAGEHWAVAAVDLNTGASMSLNDDDSMQAASVIKVFIMGAVYERAVYPAECGKELIPMGEAYDGELKELLTAMITVSDNDAGNELVTRLGQGDFLAGAKVVNEFCEEHGYKSTHLGRRFLEENPSDDNYTSVGDCARFLQELYNGTLLNVEASGKMLELLEGQTRNGKIPAGVPEGVPTANKTGEMSAGYGLGSIENDIAIVLNGRYPYILCVLSNAVQDNEHAQTVINGISGMVYQFFTTVTR